MTTSPKHAGRRADRGTWRISAAAFANVMSKAAREADIDASLAQPLTARWSTNRPTSSWSENCSERDVLRAITPGMDSGEPDIATVERVARYVRHGIDGHCGAVVVDPTALGCCDTGAGACRGSVAVGARSMNGPAADLFSDERPAWRGGMAPSRAATHPVTPPSCAEPARASGVLPGGHQRCGRPGPPGRKLPPRPLLQVVFLPFEQEHVVTQEDAARARGGTAAGDMTMVVDVPG